MLGYMEFLAAVALTAVVLALIALLGGTLYLMFKALREG
jgi:hypothetical protein